MKPWWVRFLLVVVLLVIVAALAFFAGYWHRPYGVAAVKLQRERFDACVRQLGAVEPLLEYHQGPVGIISDDGWRDYYGRLLLACDGERGSLNDLIDRSLSSR